MKESVSKLGSLQDMVIQLPQLAKELTSTVLMNIPLFHQTIEKKQGTRIKSKGIPVTFMGSNVVSCIM